MPWIEFTSFAHATGELQDAYVKSQAHYPREYASPVPELIKPDGATDSITAIHSLIPQALHHAMATFGVLMAPDLPLSRSQHEMIATVVSALNSCFY